VARFGSFFLNLTREKKKISSSNWAQAKRLKGQIFTPSLSSFFSLTSNKLAPLQLANKKPKSKNKTIARLRTLISNSENILKKIRIVKK